MTKTQHYWRALNLWAKRSCNFLFYTLMGRNPFQEELRWAEFNELATEMPQIIEAAVAESLRNRQIARYMQESRN